MSIDPTTALHNASASRLWSRAAISTTFSAIIFSLSSLILPSSGVVSVGQYPLPWNPSMTYELHLGDCLEVLRGMPADSIVSVVTDPPYGIRFMGKSWDDQDIEDRAAYRASMSSYESACGPMSPANMTSHPTACAPSRHSVLSGRPKRFGCSSLAVTCYPLIYCAELTVRKFAAICRRTVTAAVIAAALFHLA